MSCDCNCTEVTIDCNCPPTSPIDGTSLSTITSTTFDGAPVDIYNSGNGYLYTLYTNTGTVNQMVRTLTNMYITSNAAHDLRIYYNNAGSALEANAYNAAIYKHNTAPIKLSTVSIMEGIILTPGNSIYIIVKSANSTARLNWLTTFIYKYDY